MSADPVEEWLAATKGIQLHSARSASRTDALLAAAESAESRRAEMMRQSQTVRASIAQLRAAQWRLELPTPGASVQFDAGWDRDEDEHHHEDQERH